tara:strand:+ start:2306 stop:3250 length:945 start_codon:yes stop_codon:yes gene_type:complete
MKSVRQVDNLSTSLQDKINLSSTTGLNGKHMPEAIPKYDRSDSEVLYQNKNNASIVLGRDRPGNKLSGYGGAGHSSCGAIDLVVGRMSATLTGPEADKFCNPNMFDDAARIYISQKTDVDKNFGIVDGNVGSLEAKSAVAVKADSVRLIGRMGIKLVTGTDEKDSIGTDLSAVYGIDLIAGNTDQKYKPLGFPEEIEILQPIPKGDNLVRYLKSLSAKVDELSNLLDSFMKVQQTFNNLTANHIHPTLPTAPFSPGLTMAPTSLQIANPSLGALSASFVKGPNYINRINISTLNSNYLTAAGPLYINSRHNRTT